MTDLKPFQIKDKVQWKWLGRVISGEVVEVFFEPIVKTIKTKKIKRNGSRENPAYLVRSEAGGLALKLQTELSAAVAYSSKKMRPRMFS